MNEASESLPILPIVWSSGRQTTLEAAEQPVGAQDDVFVVDTVMGMAELSDWCYEQTMSHAIFEGKTYYSCSVVTWSSRPDTVPERDWDPDRKCYGYWSCVDHADGGEGDIDDEERFEALVSANPAEPEAITYVFDAQAPLLFKGKPEIEFKRQILLLNLMGENEDHRGSNHSNLLLDWHSEWIIKPGIYDVHSVLQAFWRIKVNKYDNQYEAFFHFSHDGYDEATLDPRDAGEIKKNIMMTPGRFKITPIIDHGS